MNTVTRRITLNELREIVKKVINEGKIREEAHPTKKPESEWEKTIIRSLNDDFFGPNSVSGNMTMVDFSTKVGRFKMTVINKMVQSGVDVYAYDDTDKSGECYYWIANKHEQSKEIFDKVVEKLK